MHLGGADWPRPAAAFGAVVYIKSTCYELPMTRDKRVLTQHNRRWIVGLGLGLIGGMALQPTRARAFAPPRKVALDNLHTGEKLALPYWARSEERRVG